jgi:hypothetical protein
VRNNFQLYPFLPYINSKLRPFLLLFKRRRGIQRFLSLSVIQQKKKKEEKYKPASWFIEEEKRTAPKSSERKPRVRRVPRSKANKKKKDNKKSQLGVICVVSFLPFYI